eukprot:11180628-Lingulodinium_polyedra.AAC.1
MHRRFALRLIAAKYTPLRGELPGEAVVYPRLAAFPMGFVWSLWTAQRCSEHQLDPVLGFDSSFRAADFSEPI